MERDIGPLLDEFLKPWNGVLCFHFVPVCLYVCRYTGYRALTLTKDPNFPLDGTLRHTKETHFFSFVEMSVSTRDFCFRFLPIVTLVNVLHVFFLQRRKNIALFIVGIINVQVSPYSCLKSRDVRLIKWPELDRCGPVTTCCLVYCIGIVVTRDATSVYRLDGQWRIYLRKDE